MAPSMPGSPAITEGTIGGPCFHAKDGLNFQQLSDGGVRVLKYVDARSESQIVFECELDKDCWGSIVATMAERPQR